MITGNDSSSTPSSNRNQGNNNDFFDDGEVIELVDVVKKTALPGKSDSAADSIKEGRIDRSENRTEIDLDELTKEMKILSEKMPDPDQESELPPLSSPDFDFEVNEETAPEASIDFPDEELEGIMSKLEQGGRNRSPLNPVSVEPFSGMTEEKIEALIRDVVEKAVREAMVQVAEKVIKEAIESLKESLKPWCSKKKSPKGFYSHRGFCRLTSAEWQDKKRAILDIDERTRGLQ